MARCHVQCKRPAKGSDPAVTCILFDATQDGWHRECRFTGQPPRQDSGDEELELERLRECLEDNTSPTYVEVKEYVSLSQSRQQASKQSAAEPSAANQVVNGRVAGERETGSAAAPAAEAHGSDDATGHTAEEHQKDERRGAGEGAQQREEAGQQGSGGGEGAARAGASGAGESDDSTERIQANEDICAQCDDGGELLVCDGACMRSFHTEELQDADELMDDEEQEAGACNPLGMTAELKQEMEASRQPFECPTCLMGVHACSLCGLFDAQEQLQMCMVSSCGKFFHRDCLQRLAAGRASHRRLLALNMCPLHICDACGGGEDDTAGERQPLIPCRHAALALHYDCIPLQLKLEDEWLRREGASNHLIWVPEEWEDGRDAIRQPLYYASEQFFPDALPRPRRLWPDAVRQCWMMHYATRFPHLRTSRRWLARLQREMGAEAAARVRRMSLTEKQQYAAQQLQREEDSELSDPAVLTPRLKRSVRDAELPPGKRQRLAEAAGASVPRSKLRLQARALAKPAAPPAEGPPLLQVPEPQAAQLQAERQSLERARRQQRECGNDKMVERVHGIWEAAEQKWTKAAVMARTELYGYTRLGRGYRATQERVQKWVAGLRQALKGDDPRQSLSMAFPRRTQAEIRQNLEMLRMMLTPHLYQSRYTSFGRHFTEVDKLREVVERLRPFLRQNDVVVDFSCGSNAWLLELKEAMITHGLRLHAVAFDIITPKHLYAWTNKSWHDCELADIVPSAASVKEAGPRLVIGLNPPFGKKASWAAQFVEKAATFAPRLMALIVPPETVIPAGYHLLLEDRELMAGSVFHSPATTAVKSWNRTTPSFRILLRNDFAADVSSAVLHGLTPTVFSAEQQQPPPPPPPAQLRQQQLLPRPHALPAQFQVSRQKPEALLAPKLQPRPRPTASAVTADTPSNSSAPAINLLPGKEPEWAKRAP